MLFLTIDKRKFHKNIKIGFKNNYEKNKWIEIRN